ncbi:Fcf2 pre-rRNA processing-domain-containing protein [Pilobolus umbonatus]|nr:Fcf2 pre-rRNA processing-domain-containing protein [Pilobolus umbonatus]
MITLSESKVNKKLPKLEAHLSKDSLYIDDTRKQAKLSEKSIAMVASGEKIPKNVPLVVVANKDEEKSRMSQKQRQEERARTSGKGWFDMPKPEMTDELKRDLQVLKMRHVLDRKRHYKKMGKKADPTYFQVGTIIESPTEFFSARMTRKERKGTIVDELLANEESKQYYKRKFNETQEKKRSGGKKDFKKLKAQRR